MLDLPRVRCAPFHQARNADPIGSGPAYDAFLVVDVALPWDREVTTQEPIRSILEGAKRPVDEHPVTWRALARVPAPVDLDAARRRLTVHRARRVVVDGVELRGPYLRDRWSVGEGDLVDLGRALVAGNEPTRWSDSLLDDGSAVDLLVCTHGRRDQCCGSFGTTLFERLGARFGSSGDVDCQRISHTGGHRFAPTAITFPDGYAWSHLDDSLVERLLTRADPPERFAANCRGSALFDGGPAQAADRAGLVEVGWEWADAARAVEVIGFDRTTMATTVRATALLCDGSSRVFDVVVLPDREVPMPTCGLVDGPEYRTETVWRVDDVRSVVA